MDPAELNRRADTCRDAAAYLRAHNQTIAAAAVEALGRQYEAAPQPRRPSLSSSAERTK